MINSWEQQFNRVIYPYVILKELSIKEQYGYYLLKIIEFKYELFISESALYSIISRFKKEGLVLERWIIHDAGIPRKYIDITTLGRLTLNKMKIILHEHLKVLGD